MSIYLALDKSTGDLIFPDGGGVARVDDARFVVQHVQSRLNAVLGAWILDPLVGWVNRHDFEKGFDTFDIENRARKIILSTEGVKSIITMSTTFSQRILTITFTANTIYGIIDVTIPWE